MNTITNYKRRANKQISRGRIWGRGSTRTIFSGVFPLIMLMTLAAFGQNRRNYLSSHSPMTHCLHTLLSVFLSLFLPHSFSLSPSLLLSLPSCLSQSLLTHAFLAGYCNAKKKPSKNIFFAHTENTLGKKILEKY